MIGNVLEWTNDLIDATNIDTDYANEVIYGEDYIWRGIVLFHNEGIGNYVSAIRRGGYWSNGAAAGTFALSLTSTPFDWGWTRGFRCSKSPTN